MSEQTVTAQKTYSIDKNHSTVRFRVRHLMISKVHGHLGDVSGSVAVDTDAPGSVQIDVAINPSGIDTGNAQRDGHLKSPYFLDVETYPTMTYKSTQIVHNGGNEYEVVGDLTMHGATKPVKLSAEITDEVASPFGGFKIGVTATGKLNREDFGLTWNQVLEAGGVMVGTEINIQIELELDRPA